MCVVWLKLGSMNWLVKLCCVGCFILVCGVSNLVSWLVRRLLILWLICMMI